MINKNQGIVIGLVALAAFVIWFGNQLAEGDPAAVEPGALADPGPGGTGSGAANSGTSLKPDYVPLISRPLEAGAPATTDRPESSAWAAFDADIEARKITGRVQDGKGTAVAGARVAIRAILSEDVGRPMIGDVVAETRSDEHGGFVMDGFIRLGERYALDVSHPDFAQARVSPLDPLVPSSLEQIVTLRPGASVTGRVTDGKGGALVGVRVTIYDSQARALDPIGVVEGEATTDADGHYAVEHLAEGVKRIAARLKGRATADRSPVRVQGNLVSVNFRLRDGTAISGRVVDVDTQQGVPGVAVRAAPVGQGNVRTGRFGGANAQMIPSPAARGDVTETDAQGRFTVPGLGGGLHVVSIVGKRGRGTVANAKSGADDVTLTLKIRGVVTGKVLASDGAPITRFSVAISHGSRPAAVAPGLRQRTDDPNGTFTLTDVPPGRHHVVVEAPGYAPGHAGPITTGLGERVGGVVVVLRAGSVVHGRVIAADGDPVPGARMALIEEVQLAASRTHPGILASRRTRVARKLATTFADGSFLVPNIGEGRYVVRVSHPDYSGTVTQTFQIAQEATAELPDIVLERGAMIRGVVQDRHGRPDHAATVSAVPDGWKSSRPIPPATTDSEGRFVLGGLKAGRYRIVVVQRRGAFQPIVPAGRRSGEIVTVAAGDRKMVVLREE
ncbi:MAG: hypothetical protein CMJ83_06850 [Planctomycetes bacterium]|nr:hypothetical protein [Planctomycetota bacterium]